MTRIKEFKAFFIPFILSFFPFFKGWSIIITGQWSGTSHFRAEHSKNATESQSHCHLSDTTIEFGTTGTQCKYDKFEFWYRSITLLSPLPMENAKNMRKIWLSKLLLFDSCFNSNISDIVYSRKVWFLYEFQLIIKYFLIF